jgi:hypothetical protein
MPNYNFVVMLLEEKVEMDILRATHGLWHNSKSPRAVLTSSESGDIFSIWAEEQVAGIAAIFVGLVIS